MTNGCHFAMKNGFVGYAKVKLSGYNYAKYMAVITVSDAVYARPSRILNFICLLFALGSIIHHYIIASKYQRDVSTIWYHPKMCLNLV